MTTATGTLTGHSTAEEGDGQRVPHLVLCLQCARPAEDSVRVVLEGIDALALGRGPQVHLERHASDARLTVPCDRASAHHARIERRDGGWYLVDLNSKNGTRVNGTRLSNARLLHDRDIIEIGTSFFLFRDQIRTEGVFTDLRADQLAGPPALATLAPRLAEEFTRLRNFAGSERSLLIVGETGTGKEELARAVHQLSARSGQFLAVNCGAIAESLVESSFFGHRKGAFSGATEEQRGFVRAADDGTLLLDEIAELTPASQVALLRVLQECEVVPVGATQPIAVNVRFIAATHQDVVARIADGRFRRDLFTRLKGMQIELPPLRERLEDFGMIVGALLRKLAPDRAGSISLRCAAGRRLLRYDWPGNVRELENALGAALSHPTGNCIGVRDLPEELRSDGHELPTIHDREQLRQRLIELHRKHRGVVSAVAREIGKARQQVHRWNRLLAIDPDEYRE